VEPYNTIFAMHETRKEIDVSLMLDNAAVYDICKKNLEIEAPHFTHVNRLIAQCISACTASLRYESEASASLQDIVTNLVPMKPYRYPIVTLAPVRKEGRERHENFTTPEIVSALFEERNLMCSCTGLNKNRYMSAVILLRGDSEADAGTEGGSTGGSGKVCSTGFEPIQINAVKAALGNLKTPAKSHQRPVRMVPWTDGFKVGVINSRPCVVKNFKMAKSARQGIMMGNNSAVRQILVQQYQKFCRLFFHKAYVWQFLAAGGEAELFEEAREGFRKLINHYEQLLEDCVQGENDSTENKVKSELVGRTRTGLLEGETFTDREM
jgi:tubulin alpha